MEYNVQEIKAVAASKLQGPELRLDGRLNEHINSFDEGWELDRLVSMPTIIRERAEYDRVLVVMKHG